MVTMLVEFITPKLAATYLERNKNNRNIRDRVVEAYAREMKAGNWVVQHQGIAFNENGDLVDGQHRLHAIVKAGVPVQMTVTRGLPVECVGGIDQGAKRKFEDVLKMQYADEADEALKNTRMVAAIRSVVRYNINHGMNLTFNEVRFLYKKFQDEFDVIHRITNGGKSGLSSESAGAVASALIWGEPEEAIVKWCKVFANADVRDCEGYNIAAAINWRRQMDDAKLTKRSMSRNNLFLGTENSIWNFCNDTEAKVIKIPKAARYEIKGTLIKAINS